MKFGVGFYLMLTSPNDVLVESVIKAAIDWFMSHGRHYRANIINNMWNAYALFYA